MSKKRIILLFLSAIVVPFVFYSIFYLMLRDIFKESIAADITLISISILIMSFFISQLPFNKLQKSVLVIFLGAIMAYSLIAFSFIVIECLFFGSCL